MRNIIKTTIGLGAGLAVLAGPAMAETVEVKAVVTKFSPEVVFIQPGDTVKWVNMTGHLTASYAGLIPEGAKAWESQMGEDYQITFDKPGVYVYRCTPHESMGMTGSIVVGELPPKNLQEIVDNPKTQGGMLGRGVRGLQKAIKEKQGS